MPGKGRNRGTIAIQSGARYRGARSLAHRMARFREELPMQSAYDAFQEGNRLLASENPHAAVIALERARDLEPDKASVRETLARAYFRSGRFAAAAAEFSETVEIDPVNDY